MQKKVMPIVDSVNYRITFVGNMYINSSAKFGTN